MISYPNWLFRYFPSRKRKGNAILAIVIILAIVASILGLSIAKATQVSMNSTTSNQITIQAQQYADSKANLLKSQNYKNIASKGKSSISGSKGFYDEVIVSAEVPYPNDTTVKQKQCTINVYKGNETIPRATIHLMRYSTATNELDIGEPEYLGAGPRTFVAKQAGFCTAGGSNKPQAMSVQVNGKTLGYVTNRDYGTGTISVCVPVPKGATVTLSGKVNWAYWSKLKA